MYSLHGTTALQVLYVARHFVALRLLIHVVQGGKQALLPSHMHRDAHAHTQYPGHFTLKLCTFVKKKVVFLNLLIIEYNSYC